MFELIKKRIDSELVSFIRDADKLHSLSTISPLLFSSIQDFVLREGKRVRPTLFIIGYLGYSGREAPGLFRSAVALELLHDFMLVHDDIIDKSETRRGKPSMHALLQKSLHTSEKIKFNGQDLAIVVGDIIYAMALYAFLNVEEEPLRKEKAFRRLIEAALYTGSGEFIELLYGMKSIDHITQADIYKIYDLKTAQYTFSYPLTIGAALAGVADAELKKIFSYGIYLGRSFQIKDDILGMFGSERAIGKSTLTDLQEAKKTLLIWYAYHNGSPKQKRSIRAILEKKHLVKEDLLAMQKIVTDSGSLEYAKKEVVRHVRAAEEALGSLSINSPYQDSLSAYAKKLLSI